MSSPLLLSTAAAPTAAASDDGSAKRNTRLEEDLVAANKKVDKLSFENQQNLNLLSRIYNVVTKDTTTDQKSMLLIKSMIESSNIPGLSMATSPISRPLSAFSATTGPESSTSGTGTEESDGSEQANSPCEQANMLSSFLMKFMRSEKEPTKQVDKAEFPDEDFTFEEELAGIPDARGKDRPALREAMHLDRITRKKLVKESVQEKHRLAGLEGEKLESMRVPRHLMCVPYSQLPPQYQKGQGKSRFAPQPRFRPTQKPMVNPPQQPPVKPAQKPSKPSAAPKAAKPVARRSQPTGRTSRPLHLRMYPNVAQAPAPGLTSKKPEASTPVHDTEDEDEDDDILGIANSPKASDTFGIVFDKTKIDSELAARLSGKTGSTDARRSILIENLPSELTLHKLLAYVRGGTIVTTRFVPDNLNNEHGQVALITFKTATEAELSCRLTCQNLSLGLEDEGMEPAGKIQVTRLPTATYPTSQVISPHGSGASTRCVAVDNFTRKDLHSLCKELSLGVRQFPTKMHALEEMWFIRNTLHMNFTSIAEAEKAHEIISCFSCQKYAEQLRYCADPCAATTGVTGKVASSGMGLKSLLETVGLAGYARSQPDFAPTELPSAKQEKQPKVSTADTQAVVEKALVSVTQAAKTQTPVKPESTGQKPEEPQLLIDIFGNAGQGEQKPKLMPSSLPMVKSFVAVNTSTSWTAELMHGLDLL